VCKAPHGHWKVLSTIAAMTVRGMLCSGTFDGATDTDTFVAFVREGLAPVLVAVLFVVMVNLPGLRWSRVDDLFEAAGCYVLLLPPYSPVLNPIVMAISKVKALLRRAERRTIDALQSAVGDALARVTSDDATAYVRHCGYGDTRR
jgi:transposase